MGTPRAVPDRLCGLKVFFEDLKIFLSKGLKRKEKEKTRKKTKPKPHFPLSAHPFSLFFFPRSRPI
jgi:hypothetical protein